MAKKKYSLEQAFLRLEEIVDEMENPASTLDEILKLYKEGVELSIFCKENISSVETEVKILQKNLTGFTEEPFMET